MKTITIQVPEKTTKEQVEQFLRYAPGSPTQPVPPRRRSLPLAWENS